MKCELAQPIQYKAELDRDEVKNSVRTKSVSVAKCLTGQYAKNAAINWVQLLSLLGITDSLAFERNLKRITIVTRQKNKLLQADCPPTHCHGPSAGDLLRQFGCPIEMLKTNRVGYLSVQNPVDRPVVGHTPKYRSLTDGMGKSIRGINSAIAELKK